MNPDTDEAECWYEVQYYTPKYGEWKNASTSDGAFTTDSEKALKRMRHSRTKCLQTSKRRVLRYTLTQGVILTDVWAVWDNPEHIAP